MSRILFIKIQSKKHILRKHDVNIMAKMKEELEELKFENLN